MARVSDYLARAWCRHLLANSGGDILPALPASYARLSSTDLNADGTGLTELSGGGYAPYELVAAGWTAAIIEVGGVTMDGGGAAWTATGDMGTPSAVGLYDAAGNLLLYENGAINQHIEDTDVYSVGFRIRLGFPNFGGLTGTSFWHLDWLRQLLDHTFREVTWTPPALDWVGFYRSGFIPPAGITEAILVTQNWLEIAPAGYSRLACAGPWMDAPSASFADPGLTLSSNVNWWTCTEPFDSGVFQVGLAEGGTLRAYFPGGSGVMFVANGDTHVNMAYDSLNDYGVFIWVGDPV